MPVSRYPVRTVNLKRFVLLLVTLLAFGGAVYALHRLQVRKNADSILNQARNMEKGERIEDLNESLILYERYLNFRPNDPIATDSYLELLSKVITLEPKRVLELLKAYERVLINDPKRVDVRKKIIGQYLQVRQYSQASRHLEELVGYDDASRNDPVVLEQRGLCAERQGKKPVAVERYTAAIATGKTTSDVYIRLASIYQKQDDRTSQDKARALMDQLLKDKPREPQARLARAKYFLDLKQKPQAVTELQLAIDENPDSAKSAEIVILLADLYRQTKNLPAARELLAKAVAAQPEELKFRLIYSDLLAANNDSEGSRRELRAALANLPEADPRAVDVLDRMITRRGEDLGLIPQEIRQRFEKKPGGHYEYLMGKYKLAAGKWNEAQDLLKRALPSFKNHNKLLAKSYEALAECAKAANNPEKMAEYCTLAVNADATLDSAKLSLAEAQMRLGNAEEAAKTFTRFADFSPEARYLLARIALEEAMLASPPDWARFEDALGPPPHPANMELLKIAAMRARKQNAEALAAAKSMVERQPNQAIGYLIQATLMAETDPKAALAFLDSSAMSLGDLVEVRLTKAGILASDAALPAAKLLALADDASSGNYNPDELYRLNFGLAELLVRPLNKLPEALSLYQRCGEIRPNDLTCRIRQFETLLSLKRFNEADAVIDQIRGLEGAQGPGVLFANASRQALTLQPGDKATLNELRTQMETVTKARPKWGRAMLLAAELDDAAGDGDAALEKFRKALLLGERRPGAVRRHVALLVERRRYAEAKQVLDLAEKSVALGDDQQRQMSLIEAMTEKTGKKSEEIIKATADSKNAADHAFRGQWYLLANKPEEAISAFEKANSIDGTSPETWMGLILASLQTANPETVKANWDKASAALAKIKFSDGVQKAVWLGLVHESMGLYPQAKQIYEEAAKQLAAHPLILVQLASLQQRLGLMGDARQVYELLLQSNATDNLKRQARRELAYLAVLQHQWKAVPEALKMLEANAPPRAEDLRMAGFVLSYDPFRREEARELLKKANRLAAPGPNDVQRLAEFAVRDSKPADAEAMLSAAGNSLSLVQLMLLHTLQIKLDMKPQAEATLARIRKAAPGSWELAVEEARTLAAKEKPNEAARLLLTHPFVKEPARKLAVAAKTLAEIGCHTDAETLYKDLITGTTLPGRHSQYLFFLANQGRSLEALNVAVSLPEPEYETGTKAMLLTATLLPLPRVAARPGERGGWDAAAEQVSAWLAGKLAAKPNDPMLLTLQGVLADAQGNHDSAMRSFEAALAADTNAETAMNSLAWLHALATNGDAAKAKSLIDALITKAGPKPALLDTRALIRLRAGDVAGATADNQAARVQLPEKAAYYFRLAQIMDKANNAEARKQAMITAQAKGLRKETLHPLEWPAYDALAAAVLGKR